MSNCIKNIIFSIKLLKIRFLANDEWQQVPSFDLLNKLEA